MKINKQNWEKSHLLPANRGSSPNCKKKNQSNKQTIIKEEERFSDSYR